ncbi:Variable major outer membrane lipoprotein (plasmid) [Borrelia crocidurae DOU]|uniref:Variable large protein n=1 Tax=Borrelia crocidurae DOU TaxID=1293575 RepID=W5SJ67_9SPIR|nr:Variable major outer membrane lipoprotein [Borrelia crocidurae DOU]
MMKKLLQGAGISAVNKLLVAIEDIIKKTVKNVLEKVKQEVLLKLLKQMHGQ